MNLKVDSIDSDEEAESYDQTIIQSSPAIGMVTWFSIRLRWRIEIIF